MLATMLAAASLGYALAWRAGAVRAGRKAPFWHAAAYLAGLALLALALLGPPDHFADRSFAAHMVQHLLMTLAAAPLIVLGRPVQVVLRGLGPSRSRQLLRLTLGTPAVRQALTRLGHPVVVSLLFNGSMVAWHQPTLYQAALSSETIHELEHLSLLISALLFWWVLVDPVPRHHRLSSTATILVLFVAWMVCDLLGAALTLAREPLYPLYAAVTNPWGLTPGDDQRIGGLVMWVGGAALFASLLIGFVAAPHVRRRASPRSAPERGWSSMS
jgi:cytochrome c oxidase assembly factor CtaG